MLILVGLLGLAVGSVLPRVVHRSLVEQPALAGRSSVTSGSPDRRTPARARHAVPLVALTAALFVLVTWRAVQLGRPGTVPALLAFTALGVAVSAVDVQVRRIPDVLVLPAYPLLAGLLAVAAAASGDWSALVRAVLGAGVLFACFLAMALIHPPGMGFGDVKLAGVVGLVLAWFSWPALFVGVFAAFVLGAVVGLGVMATSPLGRRATVPFGPFLVAGALLALCGTDPVAGPLTWS